MKTSFRLKAPLDWTPFALLLLVACQSGPAPAQAVAWPAPLAGSGSLLIVGGGNTLPEFPARALQLARGTRSIVAVLPQASESEGRGIRSVEMWLEAGAAEALLVDGLESAAALAMIQRADILWMPGGSQSRLMDALQELDLAEAIRGRFRAGAVVGGTSAGAAVMPAQMITGLRTPETIEAGGTETAAGLGLWPGVLIDQHFFQRKRVNRLLSAVCDTPEWLGIGIGESTAVVVHDGVLEVIGAGNVLIVDGRRAQLESTRAGANPAALGIQVAILRNGFVANLADPQAGTFKSPPEPGASAHP